MGAESIHGLKIVVAKHAGANKEPLLIVATMNSWVGLRNETDEVTQIVEFALPCNWCHLAHNWWLQSIFVETLGSDKPSDLGLEGGERGVRLRTWPVHVMVAELLKLGSCCTGRPKGRRQEKLDCFLSFGRGLPCQALQVPKGDHDLRLYLRAFVN